MDEIDKRIIKAMYPGGTLMQSVKGLCDKITPLIEMKELQERLEIMAGTTRYVKDEGRRTLRSTGIEMVSLTAHGLQLARDLQ
jgi:hypothetical protein